VKLLQRIALALGGAKPAAGQRDASAPGAAPEERRRRRGGRGRGRGAGTQNGATASTQTAPSTDRSSRSSAPPQRDSRDARDVRDGARGRPRWQRPPAHMLEQPLPEDVAFRPAAEGGDASIVPARRRRASRSGERVFALGNVPYVARTQAPGAPPAARAPQYDDDAADADAADLDIASEGAAPADSAAAADGTDAGEGERKRRRRGRRGGRGRRRPTPDGTPETDSGGHDAVA
jgi:ribonuclease E